MIKLIRMEGSTSVIRFHVNIEKSFFFFQANSDQKSLFFHQQLMLLWKKHFLYPNMLTHRPHPRVTDQKRAQISQSIGSSKNTHSNM